MRHRAGIVLYCKETKEVLLIRRIRDGKELYCFWRRCHQV